MIFYGGAEEGLCFDVDFLGGDMARLLQCLHHAYIWRKSLLVYQNYMFRKMMARPTVVRNNFKEGFGHYTDQNIPLKR